MALQQPFGHVGIPDRHRDRDELAAGTGRRAAQRPPAAPRPTPPATTPRPAAPSPQRRRRSRTTPAPPRNPVASPAAPTSIPARYRTDTTAVWTPRRAAANTRASAAAPPPAAPGPTHTPAGPVHGPHRASPADSGSGGSGAGGADSAGIRRRAHSDLRRDAAWAASRSRPRRRALDLVRCGRKFLVVPVQAGLGQRALGPQAERGEQRAADQRDQADGGEGDRQHPRPQRQPVALVTGGVHLRFDGVLRRGDLVIGQRDLGLQRVAGEVVVGVLGFLDDGARSPGPPRMCAARRSSGSW